MTPYYFTQPFVIVAALIERDGKILLVQENHPPDKGKWNMPAGKLDMGENPLEAVTREVREESGLDFTPTAFLGVHSVYRDSITAGEVHEAQPIRLIFTGASSGEVSLGQGDSTDGIPEIASYKWLTPEEILAMGNKDLRYHDTMQVIESYFAGVKYPLDIVQHFIQH